MVAVERMPAPLKETLPAWTMIPVLVPSWAVCAAVMFNVPAPYLTSS